MMINRERFKKSESFKNVEKDLGYIVSKIHGDNELLNLLSLKEPHGALESKDKQKIIKECITIKPVVDLSEREHPEWSHLSIMFDGFAPNMNNTEYRDKFLHFNILCDANTWDMDDFKLRPYQIAGRLDVLFNNQRLADSYKVQFLSGNLIGIDDNIGGLNLTYAVTYNIDRDGIDEE